MNTKILFAGIFGLTITSTTISASVHAEKKAELEKTLIQIKDTMISNAIEAEQKALAIAVRPEVPNAAAIEEANAEAKKAQIAASVLGKLARELRKEADSSGSVAAYNAAEDIENIADVARLAAEGARSAADRIAQQVRNAIADAADRAAADGK